MEPGAKVLVVDDYVPNANGMRDLLVASGHTVRVAHNGADALRFAADEPFDLIVLDVVMPGMSGVEVCRELKSRSLTRFTPVVLVTGSQEHAYRLDGLDAGADDFINKPLDVQEFRTRVRSLLRMKRLTDELESTEAIVTMLGQIVEARDPYTEGHCARLAEYATALGAALGLSEYDLDTLSRGAALHDVGKIGVPDSVLLKPGRLDADEMALMRQHPVIGDGLCRTVRSLERVRPIVRSHHEREDGRGYPDGLSKGKIPLLAQIVGVVDVFDALTTTRPYRKAMSVPAAYELMLSDAASGWCSVDLVVMFIDLHRNGPVRGDSYVTDMTKPELQGVSIPLRYADLRLTADAPRLLNLLRRN
jgi:putative two-component system response regulator